MLHATSVGVVPVRLVVETSLGGTRMDDSRAPTLWLRAACWRALLLGFGWWALAEGKPSSFAMGAAMVAAAGLASLITSPPRLISLRLRPLAILLGTFLYGSLRGGWDVARRALSPTLPLSPVLIHYSTRLDSGPALEIFTSLLTLMPGTLAANVRGRDLQIHALVDRGGDLQRDLMTLEGRVGRAFGIQVGGMAAPDA